MTMYDRLGSLLSEALEKGELPTQKEDSPLSSDFFESPTQEKPDYQVIKNFKQIPEQVKSALAFIQIPESASYEEAKKIYREKLMYYHPDRRNDNPVLQKIAKEKTARLLKEWETVEQWYESLKKIG